jgi:hypothetical protein
MRAIVACAAVIGSALPGAAQPQPGCQMAITEFRDIVNTETSMGHVSGTKQSGAMTEPARIEQMCRAGRDREARAALQALQRRMGFR